MPLASSSPSLFPKAPPSSGPWISAHCDGGARGNPGPAGFGALIQDADGNVLAELSEFLGIQTNNFAEYSGLLASLDYARELSGARTRAIDVEEVSDDPPARITTRSLCAIRSAMLSKKAPAVYLDASRGGSAAPARSTSS